MNASVGDVSSRFGYRAFGFFLSSNCRIPGLRESPNPGLPVLQLDFDRLPSGFDETRFTDIWYLSRNREPSGTPALIIYHTPATNRDGVAGSSYWLKYADGTSIIVGEGVSQVWVTWPAWSSLEEACTYLLGPVMAILAQLRGTTCLHGSAVVIAGRIVGFLGPQGAGKSTTATGFARAGYPVAADDLILLLEREQGFAVDSTYPVLRLWPRTVSMLFGHEDAVPPISRGWDKRGLDLSGSKYCFQEEPLPLAALYLLGARSGDESAPFIAPLSGAPALLSLVRNSWAHYVDKPSIVAAQLRVLTRLSQCVPMRTLVAHEDHTRLPALFDLVTADVRAIREGCTRVSQPQSDWMPSGEHLIGPVRNFKYRHRNF